MLCYRVQTLGNASGNTAPFAGALAALVAFLYVVLSLERYSLRMGTLAVFAAPSVAMVATRRIRWGGA
jgi:inner membrane protein